MDNLYIYIILALLPLSSLLLMLEVNPYHALVIRGVLGAIAVIAYVVLGAADVALTEALMGTMLAVSLYIIAVRSSLVMRLGIVKSLLAEKDDNLIFLIKQIKEAIAQKYLRLELITYDNQEDLKNALKEKEIHGICTAKNVSENDDSQYELTVRVDEIWQLIKSNISSSKSKLKTLN